ESAAGDRRARAVVVVVEPRRHVTGVGCRSLGVGPAVVAAPHAAIDLLPGVLADVADVEQAGARVEGEAPGVAQAIAPDLGADAGLSDERVVAGDRAVRVDAQDLTGEVAEVLGVGVRLPAVSRRDP